MMTSPNDRRRRLAAKNSRESENDFDSFEAEQHRAEPPPPQQQQSVDSLLIAYSPPNSTIAELASLNLGSYQPPSTTAATALPAVSYAKVRPEPVNERSIVDSVVGFFHDVVGSDAHSKHSHPGLHHAANKHHRIAASNSSHLLSNASTSAISEIKEQIEWIHFENFVNLDSYLNRAASQQSNGAGAKASNTSIPSSFYSNNNSSLLLVIGYKTGFTIWTIDLNGVATEALSIKEPNITHVKLLKIEGSQRLLIAICKLIINDSMPGPGSMNPANNGSNTDLSGAEMTGSGNLSSQSSSSLSSQQCQTQQQISILNLLTGETLHEITFNGEVLEMKSNAHLLCVNSWNRIDAFDLETFEHRFSVASCYSQISKSSGQQTNPFALGDRWLAFADNKFHSILSSQGGVSTDIEQSYTATVLNTAKNISKGLAKISESVVNSVVSKASATGSAINGGHSPRLAGTSGKMRHDSKDDYQPGICTVVDTKKYVNNSKTPCSLYDENQNWIVAHFLAHQEAIYALEFNPNGRLLCSADCLGQYFNVFQINANPYKSTRTFVKHLYSLYRGDTTSKVKNISFSNDSRWLAISTKRGTTHIFPINCYGGTVNARTHSKPYVVNRTSKHQRTAGFIDPEDLPYMGGVGQPSGGAGAGSGQDGPAHDSMTPLIINNNPKLKSLLEPLVISAYGQLKQPNANSTFQSSIISTNAVAAPGASNGLLTSVAASQAMTDTGSGQPGAAATTSAATSGSNLAATALSSAAAVTENVTSFGLKNFSLLATNTSNMIQYDNVCAVAIFGDSRGYLSPEEPRDFALNRLRPAPSLFVISDVNGNLVEYQLDVVVDTSKAPNNKPTNDSPVMLKLTPKAQWPLQRFISSDELRYPIQADNPLICNSIVTQTVLRKHSANHGDGQAPSPAGARHSYSPSSLYSNSPTSSVFPANMAGQQVNPAATGKGNDEWIKLIEINTHMGPHRRLFMGPQFVFKTFNSNLSTTLLNAGSSSVMSDAPETPIIDLAGDIELNSLDLSVGTSAGSDLLRRYSHRSSGHATTSPMQINTFNRMNGKQKFDTTPTYIEVGAGSFQEGMPILCGAGSSGSRGSQKSLNSFANGSGNTCSAGGNPNSGLDLLGDNLIESLADAMNESHGINTPNSVTSSGAASMHHSPLLAPVSLAYTSNPSNMSNGFASAVVKPRSQTTKSYPMPLQPSQASATAAKPGASASPTQAIAINNSSNKIKKTMVNKEDNGANLLLMHANSASPSLTVGSYLLINNGGMGGVASAFGAAQAAPSVNTSSSSNSCTSSSSANSNEEDNLSVSSAGELGKHRHHSMSSKLHHHDDVLEGFSETRGYRTRHLASIENLDLDDEPNLLH